MLAKVDYVMVNVSQMERSVEFYRDTLGIALKFASPGWSEFQTGETTLALHLAPPAAGANRPAAGPSAGSCSLGFSVADVERTCADLAARGARFVMPPADRPDEGIRLAVCLDPDGLPISFAQRIAGQPGAPPPPT
jgi:lactoylglutathione lyase